jgi:uncharacterized protein YbbC (DUF1343 family)
MRITRLFTPEHGLSAETADGLPVPDGDPGERSLSVVSLYGSRMAPGPKDLKDLELVLVDLQDVGTRFYTFLWTVSLVMEACARAAVPVRVLDRPNPLGGVLTHAEGPIQDPDIPFTFLGRWPIPIRHSLTMGELCRLLNAEMEVEVDLAVVPMEGWRRDMLWPDTGLTFHPPSPGLPSLSAILLYPGLALLEGTNVGEGRGTPYSFQWVGASWVDGGLLANHLNEEDPPGILAFPHTLDACPGVRLEVTDPRVHRPVALGLRVLALLRRLWPKAFAWRPYPTAANPGGEGHLLRLLGSRALVRNLEEDPGALDTLRLTHETRAEGWTARAKPHLLYS